MSNSLDVSPINVNSLYNKQQKNGYQDSPCVKLVPMDSFEIQKCSLKNKKTKMPLWKKISNVVTFIIPCPFYWDSKGNLSTL